MKRIIYLATRPRRHGRAFLVAVGIFAYLLTSCAGSRAPLDTPNAPPESRTVRIVPPQDGLPGRVDSTSAGNSHTAHQPAALQRFTDAIGLSTPEGRARRQAVKLAKAAVPRSIGKGAVYAPNNTGKILNAGNKGGPVAAADSGGTVTLTAIDKNKGAAATGAGASATQTIEKPGFWGAVLGLLSSWWWLLVLVLLFLFRKRLPVVGPFFS